MSENKIKYVVGFCFDRNMDNVALIQKQKPDWQKGLFNGIGGKIEADETPVMAMMREFKEEAGVEISVWKHFATMSGKGWMVECFYTTAEPDLFQSIQTQEVEEVFKIPVAGLQNTNTISNLQWLIPLAIDNEEIDYSVTIL